MRQHSKEYTHYINSFDWYLRRRTVLDQANGVCQKCHSSKAVEVHHLTYERLGNEGPKDLMAVCEPCHKIMDKKRESEREDNRYWLAVDTFATKKHGEDWEYWHSEEEMGDEFNEWLEWKRGG